MQKYLSVSKTLIQAAADVNPGQVAPACASLEVVALWRRESMLQGHDVRGGVLTPVVLARMTSEMHDAWTKWTSGRIKRVMSGAGLR